MDILLAPDSFKGSLTAIEVAESLAEGITRVWPNAGIVLAPMADGGEGTVDALVRSAGGRIIRKEVTGPIGLPVNAGYGILADGKTAVVEVAAASGISLIEEKQKNPIAASSTGTGQLIKDALAHGCSRLIVGLGGSATVDGGMGLMHALGVRFLDFDGRILTPCGGNLVYIDKIDISNLDTRLKDVEVIGACDVKNTICGREGAAPVFGPQKGATPEMVSRLDRGLARLAEVLYNSLKINVLDLTGGGAAGGIGAALFGFLGARLESGIQLVMQLSGLEEKITGVDLVFTGEGKTDCQTIYGKVPVGVASLAKKHRKKVVCISGSLGDDAVSVLGYGIDALLSVIPAPMTLENAMNDASRLVADAAERTARLIKLGLCMHD